MAQAFLETVLLLRRATPIPARTQAPAASRPAFAIRDPESDRAQARSQDTRMQTARAQDNTKRGAAAQDSRTQEARTQEARMQHTRTEFARPERDRPDVSERSGRPSVPARASRDGAVSRQTATADDDPSGKAPPSRVSSAKGGTEVRGATRGQVVAVPTGATGSPEAAMATAMIGEAAATVEVATGEETENDGEVGEALVEEPDVSLLALGFLPPPPPPKSPVLPGAPSSSGEGEALAGSVPSSSGPAQPSAGALKPSQGVLPGLAPVVANDALTGAVMAGKADPAVAVHDTKPTPVEIALPDGFQQARESFDSMLAGAAVAPAAAASQTTSAAATQTPPPAAPPIPLGAVPMTIGLRSLQGSNHFEIRLDPGDLGRIDVSLDIDKERGTVMAHLVVDRVETLALLQRDTGSLQQALSQAGLDASEANINLSLRSDTQSGGQGSEGQGADGRRPEGRPSGPGLFGRPDGHAALEPVPMRNLRGLTGLDIRI